LKTAALTDQQLEDQIEPALKALRPGRILKLFFLNWVVMGSFIGFGSVWASEKTWDTFPFSTAWILTVVLGSGLSAAGPALVGILGVRRFLTRTNAELRDQIEKDWSTLTRPGWPGRLIGFSLAVSVVAGTSLGILLSLDSPEERFLGSTVATIGVVSGMFLVSLLPMVFGVRLLLKKQLTRHFEGSLAPGESTSTDRA
jgi:hypothetical protein